MRFTALLHNRFNSIAVKIFNRRESSFIKQQAAAGFYCWRAFICGVDYQLFALTNSYVSGILLFVSHRFYYVSSLYKQSANTERLQKLKFTL
jgi:hypothetical protein